MTAPIPPTTTRRRRRPPHAAAGELLVPHDRPLLVVGMDPGGDLGVAVRRAMSTTHSAEGRTWPQGAPPAPWLERRTAAAWTEAEFADRLDAALGDADWFAVLERPWGLSRAAQGQKRTTPPVAAIDSCRRVLRMVARRRWQRAGRPPGRYVPAILRPKPAVWRGLLGIRQSGGVKAAAVNYVREVLRLEVTDHNVAESVCLAEYGVRHAPMALELGRAWWVR